MSQNPYDPNYGDTHYYNYIADNWNFNIYPDTRFASEYGFQSMPSIETLRTATNDTIDSDFVAHRQHSPLGNVAMEKQIVRHLKLPDKDDPSYWNKFIFYSQVKICQSYTNQDTGY